MLWQSKEWPVRLHIRMEQEQSPNTGMASLAGVVAWTSERTPRRAGTDHGPGPGLAI